MNQKHNAVQQAAAILERMPSKWRHAGTPNASYFDAIERPGLMLREREVLVFLSKGCTQREIAVLLKISRHTVNDIVKRVYTKLDVHNMAEAAVAACKMGLLGKCMACCSSAA